MARAAASHLLRSQANHLVSTNASSGTISHLFLLRNPLFSSTIYALANYPVGQLHFICKVLIFTQNLKSFVVSIDRVICFTPPLSQLNVGVQDGLVRISGFLRVYTRNSFNGGAHLCLS